jgi:hypothetical protein
MFLVIRLKDMFAHVPLIVFNIFEVDNETKKPQKLGRKCI